MNAQRMKFAWARGARIEFLSNSLGVYTNVMFANEIGDEGCRIDPRDAHLEYGPLSAALRDDALHIQAWLQMTGLELAYLQCAEELMREHLGVDYSFSSTDLEDEMLALFFAEYLADQGL